MEQVEDIEKMLLIKNSVSSEDLMIPYVLSDVRLFVRRVSKRI